MFESFYTVQDSSNGVTEVDKDFCTLVGLFMLKNDLDFLIIRVNRDIGFIDFSIDFVSRGSLNSIVWLNEFNAACSVYFASNNFKVFKAVSDKHNRFRFSFSWY